MIVKFIASGYPLLCKTEIWNIIRDNYKSINIIFCLYKAMINVYINDDQFHVIMQTC